MKQSNAAEFLPIIKALAEGKTIEFNEGIVSPRWVSYGPDHEWSFNEYPSNYRIKPEPKMRPWTPDEVPLGAAVRKIGDTENAAMITGKLKGRALFGLLVNDCGLDGYFDDHAKDPLKYEYSTDGGKTWKPCGVEVTD